MTTVLKHQLTVREILTLSTKNVRFLPLFLRTIYSKSRYALPKPKQEHLTEKQIPTEKKGEEFKTKLPHDPADRVFTSEYPRNKQGNKNQINKQYSRRIARSVEEGNLRKAISLFREVKRMGIVPNLISYNIIIRGLSKVGDASKALECFDEMLRDGVKPSPRTFTSSFHAISKGGINEDHCGKVREMLDSYKQNGGHLRTKDSVFVYNSAMKALVFCGDSLAAFEIYDDMVSLNIQPDKVTLATLLLACQQDKSDGIKKACKILDEFKSQGLLEITIEVLNSIMLVYRNCLDKNKLPELFIIVDPSLKATQGVSNAKAFLNLANSTGSDCNANLTTYQMLLYMSKSLSDVEEILLEMENRGILFDKHFLFTLVTKYMHFKKIDIAADTVRSFIEHHQENTDLIVHGVLKVIRNPYDRYCLIQNLEKDGYALNTQLINCILHGIQSGYRLSFVEKVIKTMEERALIPDNETVEIIENYVNGLLRKGKINNHYLFLNQWVDKWKAQKENLDTKTEEGYSHL